MHSKLSRLPRFAVSLLVAFALTVPAVAQTAATAATPAATSWLYRGSDIPPDVEWLFGEMPNGLRYATRRNGVPPRQVSIRIAIDAGSLMEADSEKGFAHYLEHLSFRGSKYVPNGEAKRVWQRLGATFGSDTNAQTSPTQTIYKLDLPTFTPEGLEESVKILSGMMAEPAITTANVDAERRTVLAELREGSGAASRVGDSTRELLFAGQRLASRSPIGDAASLQAASPAALKAFHDRWYRPARTVIAIAGDGDPAVFEALIKKYFGGWKGVGPAPAEPDFGKPDMNAARARVVVEPGLPTLVTMAVLRPWVPKDDTIEYNRAKLVDTVALRLINRRLERRARAGGSFLQAGLSQDDVSRSVDGVFIQIVPLGEDWRAAVTDVRGVIADALTHPSSQADIDREASEFASALQVGVETSATDGGGELADTLIEAVNIRETVASPEVARDVFSNMKDRLTPAAILASTRRLMTGTPIRALLTLPATNPQAETLLTTALTTEVKAGPAEAAALPVSFDRLPKFGQPGKVVNRSAVPPLGIEFVELSNGVRLVLSANNAEPGKVLVTARFGAGRKALPADRPTVAWVAPGALVSSGIGDLGQEELDRLTSARRINMAFDMVDDAFLLRSATRASDLDDQLKLLAAKLWKPGWDPAPVNRARAGFAAAYDTMESSPNSVLGRDLQRLLHGGDPRWGTPTREQVAALTPASFRKLWKPLLKTGPIEVSIYGDFEPEKAIAAAAVSFGALPSRRTAQPRRSSLTSPSVAPIQVARTHRGPADQAAAVLAWPTGGGIDGIYESRKLDILAAIFSDRLFDQLREAEGASYSPGVDSQWPVGIDGGGSFVVTSQLKPDGVDNFFALSRSIAADLGTKPVTPDEFARAIGPMRQMIARASSGNTFSLSQLGGASTNPRKVAAFVSIAQDYARITPAELLESARRYFVPAKAFTMTVLPAAPQPLRSTGGPGTR